MRSSITKTNGAVSYSIGQVIYTDYSNKEGSSSSGVQQPYEISLATAIQSNISAKSLHVYPNPSSHFIHIKNETESTWEYKLINTHGEIFRKGIVDSINDKVWINDLEPGFYFLVFTNIAKQFKFIKIIKH